MYLLMNGLKLLKGTSNVDMFNWSDSFAFLSAILLPVMSACHMGANKRVFLWYLQFLDFFVGGGGGGGCESLEDV